MKTSFVIARVQGPSHNDVNEGTKAILNALSRVKERINNGSEIELSSCDPENKQQLYSVLGKIMYPSIKTPVGRKIPRQTRDRPKSIDELLMEY